MFDIDDIAAPEQATEFFEERCKAAAAHRAESGNWFQSVEPSRAEEKCPDEDHHTEVYYGWESGPACLC